MLWCRNESIELLSLHNSIMRFCRLQQPAAMYCGIGRIVSHSLI